MHLHKTEPTRSVKKSKNGTIYGPPGKPEFYWIIISKNGKTIDRSTTIYSRKYDALRGIIVLADVLTGHKPKSYYDHTGNGAEVVEF